MPTPQKPFARPIHPDSVAHLRQSEAMLRQPWERVVFFGALAMAMGLAVIALILTFA